MFLDDIEKRFGGVDILINNVGIESEGVAIEEVPDELWNKIINVNMSSMSMSQRLSANA